MRVFARLPAQKRPVFFRFGQKTGRFYAGAGTGPRRSALRSRGLTKAERYAF